MGASDEQLAEQAAAGRPTAYHALIDRFASPLYRTAVYLTGGRHADAEDLVQETMLAMYRALPTFEGRSAFRTWLWTILFRQAALQRRKHKPAAMLDENHPSPASSTGAHDLQLDIAAALAALNDDHRDVLVLREIEGLSYAEIADVLHLPQGTVESRIHRARQQLKRHLTDYAPFEA